MPSVSGAAPKIDRVERTSHRASRKGRAIDRIVVHYTTSRNIEGTIAHFKTGRPRVSAHYIVGQDGALVQMVPDTDAAWHAGTAAMNARSIGIEHVARLGDRITPRQSRTSVALLRWLMWTYRIPQEHVIPHCIIKPTSCCGDLFAEFGGGAAKSSAEQQAALRKWMVVNAVELPASGLSDQGLS
jgi:N-acetylmuramoyl-L-alanine amidase